MEQDRRSFLADAGRWLMLTGAATVAWDYVSAGQPEQAPNYTTTDHWWGIIIDIDKCIGCGNCVRACKAENDVPLGEGAFRTWVERYQVASADREHPKVDSPNGGYDGFAPLEDADPDVKAFFVPKMCNHCANSPCVQVCPVGATFESPDGVVLIDKQYCIGCRYCVQACPYGCRYIDHRTMTADKCDLCYHRITRGLTTACCEACPTAARQLVDLKNPNDPVHAFLKSNAVHVLKPQMATGAKVFYRGLDGSVR
jgi:Fe-S-cluster-containing dehydrogenase component